MTATLTRPETAASSPEPETDRLTPRVTLAALEYMPLEVKDLPFELRGYQMSRDEAVDNLQFSRYPFRDATAADLLRMGRQGGWLKECNTPPEVEIVDGLILTAATSVHLFDRPSAVSRWIQEQFVSHTLAHIGQDESGGPRRMLQARELAKPAGLYDQAAALHLLQDSPLGPFSVNSINFRLGRLLGCAFLGVIGDHNEAFLANELAQALEKNMAQVLFN